jgi:DNA invertase Pin-like site-specific DNA recombinase
MDLVEYRRVSTRGQAGVDRYGLTAQKRDNRSWAGAHGHHIIRTCTDEGVSGTLEAADRPGLQEAIDMLNGPDGGAQGLLVARLDRLARSVTIQEAILAAIWRDGHAVFTADGGEVPRDDVDDPMRQAMREMAAVFASLDRRLIIKRLRDGRRAKQAMGLHAQGGYAYGRQAGRDAAGRKDAVPNPDEQAAVDLIVRARRAGKSYRAICDDLEAAGIAPRKAARWSAMTVCKIAKREMGAAG